MKKGEAGATKSSSCLEEPLVSSSSGSKNLKIALKNFYRMRNLVIVLGMINLLFTTLYYPTDDPTVKKIHLCFAISLQTMTTLIPFSVYMVARNMDSSGDHHLNKLRKRFKFWCVFGIFVSMVSIYGILNLYDSPPDLGTFLEILRLFDIYSLMGGLVQWVWLCIALQEVKMLRYATLNNKHCATTNYSEAAAGGVPTTCNVAAKDNEDLKDCPV